MGRRRHRALPRGGGAHRRAVPCLAAPAGGRLAYDPTGLVKGWAVAGAAAHLDVVPEIAYSIGAGGDVVVGAGPGPSAPAPSWRIGIEDPRRPRRPSPRSSPSGAGAVATSGAAARGAHVVDPVTRAGDHPRGLGHRRGTRPALGRRLGHGGVGGPAPHACAARGAGPGIPAHHALTARGSAPQGAREVLGRRHGAVADEPAADVGRRCAPHQWSVGEEWDAGCVGFPPDDDRAR